MRNHRRPYGAVRCRRGRSHLDRRCGLRLAVPRCAGRVGCRVRGSLGRPGARSPRRHAPGNGHWDAAEDVLPDRAGRQDARPTGGHRARSAISPRRQDGRHRPKLRHVRASRLAAGNGSCRSSPRRRCPGRASTGEPGNDPRPRPRRRGRYRNRLAAEHCEASGRCLASGTRWDGLRRCGCPPIRHALRRIRRWRRHAGDGLPRGCRHHRTIAGHRPAGHEIRRRSRLGGPGVPAVDADRVRRRRVDLVPRSSHQTVSLGEP